MNDDNLTPGWRDGQHRVEYLANQSAIWDAIYQQMFGQPMASGPRKDSPTTSPGVCPDLDRLLNV